MLFRKDSKMTVGQRILCILDEKRSQGLTSAGLARHLGTGQSTVSGWKNENRSPSCNYILPICEYLSISASYLLSGNEAVNQLALKSDEQIIVDRYRQLKTNKYKELASYDLLERQRQESEEQYRVQDRMVAGNQLTA